MNIIKYLNKLISTNKGQNIIDHERIIKPNQKVDEPIYETEYANLMANNSLLTEDTLSACNGYMPILNYVLDKTNWEIINNNKSCSNISQNMGQIWILAKYEI